MDCIFELSASRPKHLTHPRKKTNHRTVGECDCIGTADCYDILQLIALNRNLRAANEIIGSYEELYSVVLSKMAAARNNT